MSKYRNIYPKIDILENDVDIKFSIFPSSIICIRSVREQVYITGECNVY